MGVSLGGGLSGAASGAAIGRFGGPLGIGIGAGIGGLLGLFTGGKSNLQKGMENKILPGLDNLINWSGQSRDKQNQLYGLSIPGFQRSNDFYKGILSPNDNTALDSLLGPQRQAINTQYGNQLTNLAQFGARGGGTNALTAQAGFNQNQALMNLVPQARMTAAQQQGQLAQVMGQLGLNWGQLSSQQQEGVLSAISALLGGQQSAHYASQQASGAIAQQLGSLLGPYLRRVFGKGGGSLDSGFPIGLGGDTGAGNIFGSING